MSNIHTDTTLASRLDRVERSLTRVRGTNLVLIGALVALVIGGANATQDTMSVRRLAVVDANGKERLVLNDKAPVHFMPNLMGALAMYRLRAKSV